MRWIGAVLAWVMLVGVGQAQEGFRPVQTQFIAALGAAGDKAGVNAQAWGLWEKDPGPRGVWLSLYPALEVTGMAPAGWRFEGEDWWLEEHGLIMEPPVFGLAAGRYLVTGGREVTTVLTVGPVAADGSQAWELADGATLGDVTHVGCRAARYRPAAGGAVCSPENAPQSAFPMTPAAVMPGVEGCSKRDYAVLFVIGMAEGG